MPRSSPYHRATARPFVAADCRGSTLLEVLIGMLLISFWLLGNAGLQAASLKLQKGAEYRLTAVTLAAELGERMEANLAGSLAGQYVLAETNSAPASQIDCSARVCNATELAAYDLSQWSQRASAVLRLKTLSVTDVTPPGALTTYRIAIAWEEPRGRRQYADAVGQSSGSTNNSTEVMSHLATKVLRNGSN
ncbi:type IV pilus modification protein PilV [Sphaerotilus microaerophilus]|uniref:Type IV pilin Tt1218-like domain-containing protein n=1 Tax=Sphaerotilus microaerophilus TaxID=2914710 RepID=A0ABN6PS97_9BURK|nr:type IV pilus modification protein PilV [Sphaerotilus sp. FB-5]BDI08054.1 hypothetical protein CATMQ487_50240 [Sphaerotilus sp. FB-5]